MTKCKTNIFIEHRRYCAAFPFICQDKFKNAIEKKKKKKKWF